MVRSEAGGDEMTDTLTPVLTANWGDKAPWKIAEYEACLLYTSRCV